MSHKYKSTRVKFKERHKCIVFSNSPPDFYKINDRGNWQKTLSSDRWDVYEISNEGGIWTNRIPKTF